MHVVFTMILIGFLLTVETTIIGLTCKPRLHHSAKFATLSNHCCRQIVLAKPRNVNYALQRLTPVINLYSKRNKTRHTTLPHLSDPLHDSQNLLLQTVNFVLMFLIALEYIMMSWRSLRVQATRIEAIALLSTRTMRNLNAGKAPAVL